MSGTENEPIQEGLPKFAVLGRLMEEERVIQFANLILEHWYE